MAVIGKAAKAVYAGLWAGGMALGAYLVHDTSIGQITAGQWLWVGLAVLGGIGGVYRITNAVSGEKPGSGPT